MGAPSEPPPPAPDVARRWGRTIPARYLLQTTREVFGSAHRAITLAHEIVGPAADRPLFRSEAV